MGKWNVLGIISSNRSLKANAFVAFCVKPKPIRLLGTFGMLFSNKLSNY